MALVSDTVGSPCHSQPVRANCTATFVNLADIRKQRTVFVSDLHPQLNKQYSQRDHSTSGEQTNRTGSTVSGPETNNLRSKKRKKPQLSQPITKASKVYDWNVVVGPRASLPSPAPTQYSFSVSQSTPGAQSSSSPGATNLRSEQNTFVNTLTPDCSQVDDFVDYLQVPTDTHVSEQPWNSYDVNTAQSAMPSSWLSPVASNSYAEQPSHIPNSRQQAPEINEDSQLICIKLVTHLKKMIHNQRTNLNTLILLIGNTNTILSRLLHAKAIHKDYVCHLLLSVISTYLVSLCEQLPSKKSQFLEQSCSVGSSAEQGQHSMADLRGAVNKSLSTCIGIADLLKKKPLTGFQVLGRHERAHVDLASRLQQVLTNL